MPNGDQLIGHTQPYIPESFPNKPTTEEDTSAYFNFDRLTYYSLLWGSNGIRYDTPRITLGRRDLLHHYYYSVPLWLLLQSV